MTFEEIVAAVADQGGFDTRATGSSTSDIEGWVNDAYRKLVVRSKWRKAQVQLGLTVTDQAEYVLPDTVEDIIEGILVDGEPYARTGQETLWRLKSGRASARTGLWAEDYSSTGQAQIELYPAPDSDDLEIQALAVISPDELSAAMVPTIPEDFHSALIDGAIATGLRRVDERIAEADSFEGRFLEAIEDLRKRGNAKLSTGPVELQVSGFHF